MTQAAAVSDMANRPIRKFNPGTFQSDEEVIGQFVVRNRELDIVLEVLRGNIDSPSCQHILVVAPRGRGKTMLLARAAAELRTDDILSGHLLPVRFMEESQEIFNLADFWLETLFHLAREIATQNPEFARGLRETHAALSDRWRDQVLEEHAHAAVLEAADRLDRKLVLMVENLQSLGENVDEDFGWKLRGVLQSAPQIMLLATATSRFEGLDDAEQPFFELFRIIGLEPLTTKECCRLWRVVSGDIVRAYQIRPLQILTGGSPRLLVIVAGFAKHRSLRQLMEELVTLIDEHTEYFRGHLEVLAKNERRVYVSVIDLWQPSKPGEIAARARMDIRVVSTMLGRLVDRGVVIVEGSGRKRLYAAAERLYCIYYKLRRERDEAAVVRNLIHFMAVYYSEAELFEMSSKLIAEAARSPAIRKGIEWAIAEMPQVDNSFSFMKRQSMERPSDQPSATDDERAEKLFQKIVAAFEAGSFEKTIEMVGQVVASRSANRSLVPPPLIAQAFLMKALAHKALGDSEAAIAACDEVNEHFGASEVPEVQDLVARALFYKGVLQGQLGDSKAAIGAYDEVIKRLGTGEAPEVQVLAARALCNKGITRGQLGESEAAIVAFDEVVERFGASEAPEIQVLVAGALFGKGATLGDLGDSEAAIATYDQAIKRLGFSEAPEVQVLIAGALFYKGFTRGQLGEPEAAIAAFDELIERFSASKVPEVQGRVAAALGYKGVARRDLGDFETEIATYDEVVERFGTSKTPEIQVLVARMLFYKGVTLGDRGEPKAAIAAFDEAIERLGAGEAPEVQVLAARALCNKGITRGQLGESEAAIAAFDEVVERFGASEAPEIQVLVAGALFGKGATLGDLGDSEAAIATYDQAIKRLGASEAPEFQVLVAKALFYKGFTRGDLGDSEAAIGAFDELIERFSASNALEIRVLVAGALFYKGVRQTEICRAEEALHTCEELERRLGTLTGNKEIEYRWRARWVRTKALLVQEKIRAAMNAFRFAYTAFVPDNETMMHEMLQIVLNLVVAGASVHELLEILSSDEAKSEKLIPLVVALRKHAGETVRAPDEVLQVAEDIRERIKARTTQSQ